MEGFVDESALFAVFGHPEAAHLAVLGLSAEQHRGEAAAAIAVSDGHLFRFRRGGGSIREAIPSSVLETMPGPLAIGQVWGRPGPRATTDAELDRGGIAFAHTSLGPL